MYSWQILREMIGKNLTSRTAICAKNQMIGGYAIIATWSSNIEAPRIKIVTWITKIHIAFP